MLPQILIAMYLMGAGMQIKVHLNYIKMFENQNKINEQFNEMLDEQENYLRDLRKD